MSLKPPFLARAKKDPQKQRDQLFTVVGRWKESTRSFVDLLMGVRTVMRKSRQATIHESIISLVDQAWMDDETTHQQHK
jgi:hypothetical protein